jgi:hypothetical protein
MTVQRLQKWLKAAPNQTAQDWTFDFHRAHARRSRNLLNGRFAHEGHLHSLYGQLCGHIRHARQRTERRNPLNS